MKIQQKYQKRSQVLPSTSVPSIISHNLFISVGNQLKSQYVKITIIYSKHNMNSPIYNFPNIQPLQVTNVQVSNSMFSHFYNTTNTQSQTFFSQALSYPVAYLCPSFPNFILRACPLYQLPVNTAYVPLETQFSGNQQEVRVDNSLFFTSTQHLEIEKECKIEAHDSAEVVKKENVIQQNQNLPTQNLSQKKIRKNKRKVKDLEYIPNRSEKKGPKRIIKENENRNVIPNEINQILSFLQKRAKSERLLRKIWAKYSPPAQECSLNRFYLLQNYMKGKIEHCNNETSFKLLKSLIEPQCEIWPANQQRHYIMLSRVLIGHFLRQDSIFAILTSKRMKSEKKLEHLRTRRVVTQIVKQMLQD